ncbi:AAA domain-containing protein [Archaeoglobus sp.]
MPETPVVGATLIKAWLPPLSKFKFNWVLMDEASQVTIPLVLLGLVKAERYVLVGDHRQLPPVLKSVRSPENYSAFNYLKEHPHRVKKALSQQH